MTELQGWVLIGVVVIGLAMILNAIDSWGSKRTLPVDSSAPLASDQRVLSLLADIGRDVTEIKKRIAPPKDELPNRWDDSRLKPVKHGHLLLGDSTIAFREQYSKDKDPPLLVISLRSITGLNGAVDRKGQIARPVVRSGVAWRRTRRTTW